MERLGDRWWRLNNLYYIIDKHGKRVLFKPNWAQLTLLEDMWYCNILLKARQLGMTTFLCIFFLDVAMFNKNTNCGIIAHNKEDAEKFFRSKIKYAYDQLPEAIRLARPADTSTAKELKFDNNSTISVGTSMRSTTLQYLHISEHGKICARFPEKAKEIRTGALNTVEQGNYVFIESTAEGRAGDFWKFSMTALTKQRQKVQLTPLDYKFFFFPWHRHPEYQMVENVDHPQELVEYYEELLENHGIVLSPGQKNWYTKKYETQQDEMKREFPSTPEEAFEAAVIGAYYAKQLARVRLENRAGRPVHYDDAALVHTAWDLGIHDDMVIWFFQCIGSSIHWIDYHEVTGEGYPYFVDLLEDKRAEFRYTYGQHFAPHDIGAREQSSGQTRQEMAAKLGLYFQQLPKLELMTGITLTRSIFAKSYFDLKCEPGLTHLSNYVKKWNASMAQFTHGHAENGHQHAADAFRSGAIAITRGLVSHELGYGREATRSQILERRARVAV